jgi:hypothetical protein
MSMTWSRTCWPGGGTPWATPRVPRSKGSVLISPPPMNCLVCDGICLRSGIGHCWGKVSGPGGIPDPQNDLFPIFKQFYKFGPSHCTATWSRVYGTANYHLGIWRQSGRIFGDVFLKSGQPRGPGNAYKNMGASAPHLPPPT